MKLNAITDLTIATQFSTVVAAVCTYLAHLIENGTILNANWMFAVYVLLVIAMIFMLFPYVCAQKTMDNIEHDNRDPDPDPFANVTIHSDGWMKSDTDDWMNFDS